MNWSDVLGAGALVPLLTAALRLAVPIILAAAGACLAERSGLMNLGIEGQMMVGAITAFVTVYYTGNPLFGAVTGALAGLLTAAVVGYLTITMAVDQIITGISVVILGTGLASFLYLQVFGITGTPPRIQGSTPVDLPVLSDIPAIGQIVFSQSPLVYAALLLVVALWWVLSRTAFGLSVRAAGESPDAADSVGVSVPRTRWITLLISGATAGMAGALVIDGLGFFQDGITGGRGWIALGVVILARWNPLGAIAGGFMFGLVDAFQLRVQAASGGQATSVPYELFQAMPYAVTLVAVVVTTVGFARNNAPKSLGVPFVPAR
ncbi:ABC transporter permease [Rhodococcus coprophilus]|uniref:Sugar ABC transporter permease n=1 Tax=Rhodococcus coprophilus TaxID=38310 RepID=A0A2X4TU50_9NOCA|nr:ABC transporter permease [Rhodococcus coprophilus]MBM7457732.1 simple sugar transport system permease protein [Rhodococcus coprophilus]SQI30353.1 sugar ABC transporter permease [Rhodococcus coprophilus]